jgi:hypothetical protein
VMEEAEAASERRGQEEDVGLNPLLLWEIE